MNCSCLRLLPTAMASARRDEKLAQKYCFKATAHLKEKNTNRIIGSFTAYDKTPEVASQVQQLCKDHMAEEDGVLECTVVSLVLYDECPTECDGEVSVVFYARE